ncbi:MAG: hypothetical protein AAGC55_33450, partial [Myxococcota bacterium]
SLFPPSSRYELRRFNLEQSATILERIWSLAGVATDPRLAGFLVESMARDTGQTELVPADLQLVALATHELGISSPAELERIGGFGQLDRAWLDSCAASTGDKGAALRLLGELAHAPEGTPYVADWAAARASVRADFAHSALAALHGKGLVKSLQPADSGESHYALAHPLLTPRVRELTAPARAVSRRAFALLGSKVGRVTRLGLRDYWALRREGIAPTTPKETALVANTRRFLLIAAGIALAVPLLALLVVYMVAAGRYYMDAVALPGGGERIMVRAGRPGLADIGWLPGPSGAMIADTGLSRPMVADEYWPRIVEHNAVGASDSYAEAVLTAMHPTYSTLIEYATSGSAQALDRLRGE